MVEATKRQKPGGDGFSWVNREYCLAALISESLLDPPCGDVR